MAPIAHCTFWTLAARQSPCVRVVWAFIKCVIHGKNSLKDTIQKNGLISLDRTLCQLCYSAGFICAIQSPHIMLMTLVARQLFPHLGQIYFRVLLGFFVLLPPFGSVPRTSSSETPSTICKSCQPCASMKSSRSIPGLVIVQPYFGWCSTSSPCASAIDLNLLL